jgi:hypothetical protein
VNARPTNELFIAMFVAWTSAATCLATLLAAVAAFLSWQSSRANNNLAVTANAIAVAANQIAQGAGPVGHCGVVAVRGRLGSTRFAQRAYGYLENFASTRIRLRSLMIILGVVLFVIGLLAHISILTTIGIIVAVIGLVLLVMGSMGRQVGSRRHYW